MNIWEKEIDDISWNDIASLIETRAEENRFLEFKKELKDNPLDPDVGRGPNDKISDSAKKNIAKEIVAFANHYGGILIVGIDEDKSQNPRCACEFGPMIINCRSYAEKLRQILSTTIDPPIPSLFTRGVEKPGGQNGEGIIVISVGKSYRAPHGHGKPPSAYIRSEASSEPMSMAEIHSAFWEARTNIERIRSKQQEYADNFKSMLSTAKLHSAPFRAPHDEKLDWTQPCAAFSISFITSAIDKSIIDIFSFLKSKGQDIRPQHYTKYYGGFAPAVENFSLAGNWLPRPGGAWLSRAGTRSLSRWEITSDLSICLVGFVFSPLLGEGQIVPGWFYPTFCEALLVAAWLRKETGLFSDYVIDVQHFQSKNLKVHYGNSSSGPPITENSKVPTILFEKNADPNEISRMLKREIGYLYGIQKISEKEIDINEMAEDYNLVSERADRIPQNSIS